MTETHLQPNIGAAIRRLRKQHGWTQAVLAEKVDSNQFYISALERGDSRYQNMTLARIEAFARAFSIRPSDLLSMVNSQ